VNRDAKPNIDEYGRGSARTPGGLAIGCAVCTAANIGVRYNKTIPRLSDGTPDMRSLGSIMGSRCRRVNGTQHGLALYTNDHVGKKWATCCIYLQLRAWGIACRHGSFSWSQIVGFARSRKPVAMPGQYGKIPRVATTSYSLTSPARGRSDSYTGGHMIDVWDVASSWSDGSARSFGASDSDFGSSSRPVVPPHSVLGQVVLEYARLEDRRRRRAAPEPVRARADAAERHAPREGHVRHDRAALRVDQLGQARFALRGRRPDRDRHVRRGPLVGLWRGRLQVAEVRRGQRKVHDV
jgi:hypothetical protein